MAEFECRLNNKKNITDIVKLRLEKAQYNPSLKLAIDISRTVGAPIEEIFIFP